MNKLIGEFRNFIIQFFKLKINIAENYWKYKNKIYFPMKLNLLRLNQYKIKINHKCKLI